MPAGARPSSFKKGGGFLNQVDGVVIDYQFTDEFNGKPFEPGKVKDKTGKMVDKFHGLNVFLTVLVDGAKDVTTTTLRVGAFDDYNISDDGHVIWDAEYETLEQSQEAEQGGATVRGLGANCDWAKLVRSMVENGGDNFSEDELSEDALDFTAVIGLRCRFVQVKTSNPKLKDKKRVGKDKKEYDYQDLLVEQVYGRVDPQQALAAASGTSKPATKGATKPASAAKPAGKPSKGSSLEQLTTDTLLAILAGQKDGTIAKAKLSMAVLKRLTNDPQREDVKKLIFTDDFLNREVGWTYDQAASTITLAPADEQTDDEK